MLILSISKEHTLYYNIPILKMKPLNGLLLEQKLMRLFLMKLVILMQVKNSGSTEVLKTNVDKILINVDLLYLKNVNSLINTDLTNLLNAKNVSEKLITMTIVKVISINSILLLVLLVKEVNTLGMKMNSVIELVLYVLSVLYPTMYAIYIATLLLTNILILKLCNVLNVMVFQNLILTEQKIFISVFHVIEQI